MTSSHPPEREPVGRFLVLLTALGLLVFFYTAVRASDGAVPAHRPAARTSAVPLAATVNTTYRVIAWNDLGMHCYDKDFSVWSALPPFNVIHAQVIRQGSAPMLLDNTAVRVSYSAVADANGSINTTSIGKTNFWAYAYRLFGINLRLDEGILGPAMPGPTNAAQPMNQFDPAYKWFTAQGIPITAKDDHGFYNQYPLMRIQAFDKVTGVLLAYTDIVLPVSDEMHCSSCHSTGGTAANRPTARQYRIASWSASPDPEISYRENILILHDAAYRTTLRNSKPVLCASCHYSPALDLSGSGPQGDQTINNLFSYVIHGRHGRTRNNQLPTSTNPAIIPENGRTSCYNCHPGSTTKCLRGVMGNAGLNCQDCHGGMLAVAAAFGGDRTPWLNEPMCQSCHTGDAMSNSGGIRKRLAFSATDPAATPVLVTNKRFAEENGKLFRFSEGHGHVACEGCHGSTHAIWPSSEANDNVAATQLQGHTGTIIECTTCHGTGVPMSTNGPHGMHPVNDQGWTRNHHDFFERNRASCQACHGVNLEGTVLSRAAANRRLIIEDGRIVQISKGEMISCTRCHENPLNGD